MREIGSAWYEQYARRLGGAGSVPGAEGAAEERARALRETPPASLLLAYDAARMLARAWEELDLPAAPPGDCETPRAYLHAETLINHLRTV